jgi:hypothetical protein
LSTEDPWRDPSRLTEADKARLGTIGDREAAQLDVTSDAHEFVWGFRQNRSEEERRMRAGWASDTRDQLHEQLGRRGHVMSWQLHSDDPQYATTWDGACTDCGANASAFAHGSSMWRGGKDARHSGCSGPGTAWQDEMLRELQDRRIGEAVSEFGRAVKEIHDRAWLAEQGIQPGEARFDREAGG